MSEKSLLKKFSGIFVENTEEGKEEPKSIASPSSVPISINSPYVPPVSSIVNNSELEKFNKHFENLFDKSNIPGPDYYEFDKMSVAMSNLPEESRIATAYLGLSAQGLTKITLIDTAKQYISIIEEDQKNFETTVSGSVISEIEAKKETVTSLTKSISDTQEMIENLKADMLNKSQQIQNLSIEIQNDENKISQKLNAYKIAAENKKQQINNNIAQIEKYIK